MKKILLITFLIANVFCLKTQAQTAVDFTALDCSGTSHNLFTDLNAGKVVVIAWVMPCSACANGAKAASDAVATFASSNPGKVVFYVLDDYGNTSCATLASWANTNNIVGSTIFDNAGGTIKMSDYGTDGMPKVVVLAGADHKVLFNQNNGAANNLNGIKAAIAGALIPAGINAVAKQDTKIFPNPSNSILNIENTKNIDYVIVSDINGKIIFTMKQENIKEINIANLVSGNYFLQLYANEKLISKGQFIKK